MLYNCSEYFAFQCGSKKFLDTIEDVLLSADTLPVVRDRLLDVLAGATYASCTRQYPPPFPPSLHQLLT
jgi:hypothetical protein